MKTYTCGVLYSIHVPSKASNIKVDKALKIIFKYFKLSIKIIYKI